ncbi:MULTISPECIES: hypothetical protein [Shewanella]|uniref:hypothetical protein n=1 Tax=Shewanella TaxID=22 RepID=UPI00118330CD|nr:MULTISPECIES: hypothetical protein [Shewanella]QYJ97443.1 hypothetical protein K0J45_18395 [Shewanella alkalitolerans]TVP14559.1 hypothetical protein AYI87_09255 [Shewanella sp. KCT]
MLTRSISCIVLVLLASLSWDLAAKEHKRMSPKAEEASKIARQTEAEQLEKARKAANATQAREQAVLERQQSGEWQEDQREKAQRQFNERESRESKYLKEAREAAAQERKIPKPKS